MRMCPMGDGVHGQWATLVMGYISIIVPLADPGGPGDMGPPIPRFGGPSVQFKSKTMNFRALIYIFFKKFSASLRLE